MLKKKRGRPASQKVVEAEADMYTQDIPYEAYMAYSEQYRNCKRRDIEFALTLKQWWEWWQVDDRWGQRGNKRGQIMMMRHNGEGAYAPNNIYPSVVGADEDGLHAMRQQQARQRFLARASARLRDRQHHPRAKPVVGPLGVFPSASLAADAAGVKTPRMQQWCSQQRNGWRYIPKRKPRPVEE